MKTARKPTANTTARGYGAPHQAERRRWATLIAKGNVHCWRPNCRRLIRPDSNWHLGHDDWDRTIYRGPECAACNLSAAGKKASRLRVAKRPKPIYHHPRPTTDIHW